MSCDVRIEGETGGDCRRIDLVKMEEEAISGGGGSDKQGVETINCSQPQFTSPGLAQTDGWLPPN